MESRTIRAWTPAWREATWADLQRPWDLLVIGGGITGAGIAREAARIGLRVLVVDAHDFAWGTSSRSSKMVHGGIRYLANFQFATTIHSVRERDRLLRDGSGLVEPLEFIFADYEAQRASALEMHAGMWLYDQLSRTHAVHRLSSVALRGMIPGLNPEGLRGGWAYTDAETDDARLVLRVLREAAGAGAQVLNYAAVVGLIRSEGRVCGATIRDQVSGALAEVNARAVVNAAGVWVDGIREGLGAPPKMRPLRGSHLIFAAARLPVAAAVIIRHPDDGRPLYVYPWEGVTVLGTTDLDHHDDLREEPRISDAEVDYLLTAARALFPAAALDRADILSTYAGIRPVVAHGSRDPSKEPRDHVIFHEDGLWTVSGGKLTTFRRMANDALHQIRRDLPEIPRLGTDAPILDPLDPGLARPIAAALGGEATPARALRLLGRHGADALALVERARPGELQPIPGSATVWAELRWAAHAEAVVHLDDLLLRRTRLGNTLPEGAAAILPALRPICEEELGWDAATWEAERAAYRALWRRSYAPPATDA